MIKSIGDNYSIYGLINVKPAKKIANVRPSNTTFESFNYAFTFNTMFVMVWSSQN